MFTCFNNEKNKLINNNNNKNYKRYINLIKTNIIKQRIFNLLVRGARPGKNVQLTEGEIKGLCLKSREIFLSQPILLELEAPLKICGKF